MVPGYLTKPGELISFMDISVDKFSIPIYEENYQYWHDISTIISTNSLCGLNDIVPCLRSQKLKIPESYEKLHISMERTKMLQQVDTEMMNSYTFTMKYQGIYNTFDDRMNMSLSNLTIESNMRYWEKSLIDSVTHFAMKKYGSLFYTEIDLVPSKDTDPINLDKEVPEKVWIKELGIKVATHNSWKEQASIYAMMKDKGDSKSLISVGKIRLKHIYANEYTALYLVLK